MWSPVSRITDILIYIRWVISLYSKLKQLKFFIKANNDGERRIFMVTKEEIMDIALLSKLHIDDDEIDDLTKEMMNIIKFADTINGYDGEVEEFDNINNLSNVFREDVVGESFLQSEILKNVDGGENGYFPVKRQV